MALILLSSNLQQFFRMMSIKIGNFSNVCWFLSGVRCQPVIGVEKEFAILENGAESGQK